jgi:nucleotide-binding universal stress UspA family protein
VPGDASGASVSKRQGAFNLKRDLCADCRICKQCDGFDLALSSVGRRIVRRVAGFKEKRMKPSLIVHPVSYSPSGKTALATAVALARVAGADLHVLELTGRRRSAGDPVVRPITDADVEPHFAEFVRSFYSGDVKISAVELVGDVVGAVVDYVRNTSADLVVVADHARSHGPYWRRGMYANDLARHLSVPLVSVPASRDERVEHGGADAEEATSYAEAITRRIERSAVATVSSDVETETSARLGMIDERTVHGAGEIGAGVIVVERSGGHHHVSMNSALARVLRNAPRPVLVLPAVAAPQVGVPWANGRGITEFALSR